MKKIKLQNDYSRWIDNDKVKIGQCGTCKTYQSAGWVFQHMKWFTVYCSKCKKFKKYFIKPEIRFIDNEVSCYGEAPEERRTIKPVRLISKKIKLENGKSLIIF